MILSQKRVNELLQIFENPKSISPYDNTKEREEMINATKFINDYHLYGPPPNYYTKSTQISYKNNSDNLSRNPSLNSKNLSNLNNSLAQNKKYDNYEDIEIQQSLANLRSGQKEYMKQLNSKTLKNIPSQQRDYYKTYDPNLVSTYSSEYIKNNTLYNNLLNSQNLASTQYLYGNNYNRKTMVPRYTKTSRLSDIPPNPEHVVMRQLPPNYIVSMNPISSSNLGMGMGTGMSVGQSQEPIMSQEINAPPQMIEEINTDIIPNGDIQQNEQIEEEPVQIEDNVEEEKKEEEPLEEVVPAKAEGKFKITDFNGPVTLPAGYSTDNEDEFNAIQILNQDLSSWKKQIDKPNIKVYSKLYKVTNEKGEENDNCMFYSDCTLDFPASEVIRQLNTYELRKKWEKSLEKGKLLKEEDLGNGVKIQDMYSYIKMPFIFADRDMVTRKTMWQDYQGEKDCYLGQVHSIEHPDYPEKEKPVRAIFNNRGEYVKPIDANSCKLYFTSKFDMKLNAPASMMEGKGSEGQEKWFKEFSKQCGK